MPFTLFPLIFRIQKDRPLTTPFTSLPSYSQSKKDFPNLRCHPFGYLDRFLQIHSVRLLFASSFIDPYGLITHGPTPSHFPSSHHPSIHAIHYPYRVEESPSPSLSPPHAASFPNNPNPNPSNQLTNQLTTTTYTYTYTCTYAYTSTSTYTYTSTSTSTPPAMIFPIKSRCQSD